MAHPAHPGTTGLIIKVHSFLKSIKLQWMFFSHFLLLYIWFYSLITYLSNFSLTKEVLAIIVQTYVRQSVSTLFKILKYWTSLFPWGFFTWFGLNITWININDNQKSKIAKKKIHGFSWIRRPHLPWFCLAQALISQNQRKNVKHSTNWAIEALVK